LHGVGSKRGKRSSSKTDYFGLRLTEWFFLHGFSTEMMAELIRDGLANSPPHPTPCMPSRSARASPSTPDIAFLARISANRTWPWGPDCVAGHVRLELRNVVAKYPYEKSRRFPGIQPNSGHRDYSRLSCGVAETQLGLVPGHSCANAGRPLRWQELPRFCLRASYYHGRVRREATEASGGWDGSQATDDRIGGGFPSADK